MDFIKRIFIFVLAIVLATALVYYRRKEGVSLKKKRAFLVLAIILYVVGIAGLVVVGIETSLV